MENSLENLLIENLYQKIPSNLSEITLYACFAQNCVQTVQVMDYRSKQLPTKEQYNLIKERAVAFFHQSGYENVHLLTLIYTEDTQEAKKFVLDDNLCWIMDSMDNRLIIFENQVKDFYGLRVMLEKATETEIETDLKDKVSDYAKSSDTDSKRRIQNQFKAGNLITRNYTPVNLVLIIVNIVIYICISIRSAMDLESMLEYGAMYVPYVMDYNEYYRFFTCMFLHFSIPHLAGNMVVLFFLGDNVERAVGKIKYLVIYIGSGLLGSGGSFVFSYLFNNNIVSAGASGAVFGVIGSLLWIVIRNKGRLEDMTTFRVCLLIFYALYSGVTSENIDNAAHFAGLIGGFILTVILYERKRINEN